ncbi:c-type cytochrome [Poseidonibacter lekithochrous]|uniref:c-type cytochrome n=1 Tax=Poseidonibacter lekithochrous TaxID=1904463 RepID=UPI0008FCBB3E|nr:cytochrome c [Poseidonibacter lekithochrous]QKJ21725.1 hypothetical protein ALEK_0422 [Poseidonibacter lekithochrous]
MKLIKPLTITLLVTTSIFAQSTMCFKENHNSMATIESTKLDGGECKSTYSLLEMKEKGYSVEDIKITTSNNGKYNFIYILKDSVSNSNFSNTSNQNSTFNQKDLENRIIKRMEEKKKKEIEEKKIREIISLKKEGKEIYTQKCQSCHGVNGEKSAYNVATPLRDMSIDDMSHAIGRYTNSHEFGYGYNIIMRPIAANTTETALRKIKAYLDSINKK